MRIELEVNGRHQAVDVDGTRTLLSVLREELALTGTKYGCGEGQCGACTVMIDGRATRSCRTQVSRASGAKVVTIEGLEHDGRLHPVQQAFLDEGAMQCGYCTPGMIVAGAALLGRVRAPSPDDIVRALQGNVCRCGTYPRIIAAVERAAASTRGNARAGTSPEGGK
jgi:nicotinate dehydrogenase subunit A